MIQVFELYFKILDETTLLYKFVTKDNIRHSFHFTFELLVKLILFVDTRCDVG